MHYMHQHTSPEFDYDQYVAALVNRYEEEADGIDPQEWLNSLETI